MNSHLDIFSENGYLVVQDALNSEDLEPIISLIVEVVDKRTHEFYDQRTISNIHADMSFERRWYAVLQECGRENEVFGWHTLVYSEALFNLITNRKVLDIIETLIGNEIQFNGDFWVRPKLPNEKLTTLPWHQDSAYMPNTEADLHLTVWLPLVDVNTVNGTLQFLPRSHREGLRTYHRVEGEAFAVPEIPPTSSHNDIHTLDMKKGDLLIFNNLVFHRSLLNRSETIRWSVDFRYSRTGTSLDGLWHEAIAFPAREKENKHCPTSWNNWQMLWNTSPHKDRFL